MSDKNDWMKKKYKQISKIKQEIKNILIVNAITYSLPTQLL